MEALAHIKGRKILFVGIGNVLKSDDGVGVYISTNIKKRRNISVLTVEVSIENYIGKINRINSDVLVLLDCMDLRKSPGYWDMMPVTGLNSQTTNTHNISLEKISELFNAKTYILGIQPKNIKFGEYLSPEVKMAADKIIDHVNRLS